MIAAAREVVYEGVERLRSAGTADDGHIVGYNDIASVFADTQAGTVIGRVGIVLPGTAVLVKHIPVGRVDGSGIGGRD